MIRDIVIGTAVGDALGVPAEFCKRSAISLDPITDMVGYGTHNQPPGTWSDDTSMMLCLVDMMAKGYDLKVLTNSFINWKYNGLFTPHGHVFDIGNATSRSIDNLCTFDSPPEECGLNDFGSNGNGSLMRILPIIDYVKDMGINDRFKIISDVSALTHGHFISKFACFYLIEYALELLELKTNPILEHEEIPHTAYFGTIDKLNDFILDNIDKEIDVFDRLLSDDKPIFDYEVDKIYSSGYVIHTLEAAIWCLCNSSSYEEAVLKAVNLGDDTDTTGAVTGALAGLHYGIDNIPEKWVNGLANKELLDKVINAYERSL